MENGVIYKITNPTGKIYIGKSVSFSSRLSSYRNLNCKTQKALYNSLLKYGFNNHLINIIYEGPKNTLSEKEIYYIDLYESFKGKNKNGLNLTRGGDGMLGNKQSKETILKKVKHHIGSKRTDETKQLMSESAKKRKPNNIGKKHSLVTIKKMSVIKMGKTQSLEQIQKKQKTQKENRFKKYGTILQLDLDGKIVKEWDPSFSEISKILKCDASTIRKAVISNGNKVALNHKWKYSKNERI